MPLTKARLFASILTRTGDEVDIKGDLAPPANTDHIDSAYIQARQDLSSIDSSYISARQDLSLIDSNYIRARGDIKRRTQTIADSAETVIDTFSGASIRSAKYIVSAQTSGDSQHQTQEILISHDDSTATLTSYATLLHGSATIVTYDAEYNSGTISLKADPQGFAGMKFGVERITLETI